MRYEQPITLEMAQEALDVSPFNKALNFQATRWVSEEQELEIVMPFSPLAERQKGTDQFHGGSIATLIDTAACFALSFSLGHGVPTINFRTDYLRPGMAPGVRAVAKVRRAGRTVGVVDVDVYPKEGDKLIAVGRGTFSTAPG